MAAVIGLGVLATALQGKFRVQGMPGYYEPLNLYTLVIAAPGERKSGVIRDMTRVLYDYEMQFNADHAEAIGPLIDALNNMGAEILPIDDSTYKVQYIKADSVGQ